MTLGQWLRQAEDRLAASGSPDPRPDAEWILMHALGEERMGLRLRALEEIPPEERARADRLLAAREEGEPLQYVLGEAWFYGRRFLCDRRALIPRQDTETLCEAALACIPAGSAAAVLDLCTGTGALATTIALERPLARVTGTDISPEALALAEENAGMLGAQVRWREGDLWSAVPRERFGCIVANPPYLTADEMASLQREVRCEPELALFGGEDGLDFYRRIAARAGEHLEADGSLLVEIGWRQSDAVRALFREALPGAETVTLRDLQGQDRVVAARLP